ncbi:serine/threonine-protein kinase [Enhygromyxa salina]|uniref:Serine/threonine-protein kinase PknL n=1 Tax=Enhygromyxa salina TaxID=215803 RepID=A0A2S9YV42_9BACT|nr:serine/threonine-protein kinase [Enhygromyxa salina]PRQ08968.1 Serine/threonine-protein kinase PknL [Enhygromyxa salina]
MFNEASHSRSIDIEFVLAELARRQGLPVEPVLVGQRFELLREIGFGGFGTVYEAVDRQLGRRVAIKVLDLGDLDDAVREGQLLAKFHHRNVVAIFDHGVGSDYRYFVLQLLEGPTLRDWAADQTSAQIVSKYVEAAEGIAAMHAAGLVHRDVKPSNIRIGPEGQAVVLDFGLARNRITLEADLEELGTFIGSIAYAAPEQLGGVAGDERSDEFSFCVALWEALAGENPFGPCVGSTTATGRLRALLAAGAVTGAPPPAAGRVVRALRRGLSLAPGDRFPSMRALIGELSPQRRWMPWVFGLSFTVLFTALFMGLLSLLVPSRAPGSMTFVTDTRACWSGQVAILAARQGNVDGAMWRLEEAIRDELSADASRELAIDCEVVATEFERQAMYQEALLSWHMATLFARDADDAEIERRAIERAKAINRAI